MQALWAPTCVVENLYVTFDPKIGLLHLQIQPPRMENNIFESWLGIRDREWKNTAFNMQLVESADVKPMDRKSWLYLLKQISV